MARLVWVVLALICVFAPVTPAASAPAVEDYAADPDLEFVQLSPSGERFAYVGTRDKRRKLFVYATSGLVLHTLDLGEFKPRGVRWAGEDRVLVTMTSTQRPLYIGQRPAYEFAQVYVFNIKTNQGFWVFAQGVNRSAAQAVFGSYGIAQVGGVWTGYFGGLNYFGWSGRDLYRVNLDTGEDVRVDTGRNGDTHWLIDTTGEIVSRAEYKPDPGEWKLLGAGSENRPVIASKEPDPYYTSGILGAGRTPGTVLYQTTQADESIHYYEVNVRDPSQRTEPFPGRLIAALHYDDAGGPLVAVSFEGAVYDTVLIDPARQATFDAIKRLLKGRHPNLASWSADFSKVVVHTEGNEDSGTYWLIDLKTRRADILGEARPTIAPEHVAPTKMFAYTAGDGLAMEGVLTLPRGWPATGLPLIVIPHGGPTSRDHLGFDWWAQAFANLGYAVFQPNFRGSSGYPDSFRLAGNGEWGRKMQTDVSDGITALAAQGIIDPKRACIMGGSYGGYVALAGVTLQNGLYRCAVSFAGISDMKVIFEGILSSDVIDRSPNARSTRHLLGMDERRTYSDRGLYSISPVNFGQKADAPVLLIHGRDDTVVQIAQSYRMRDALKSAGKPVEMVELKGTDHWLSFQATRTDMLKAAAAFIQKHNPPNAP